MSNGDLNQNGPEPPDPEVGEQLRRFFIELLEGQNLQLYRSGERVGYIEGRAERNDGYLGEEAEALLNSDALRRIEEHIGAVTGSGNAVPIWVVSPPM